MNIDMRWWGVNKFCPKCGREMKIDDLSYAADGKLRLTLSCSHDGVIFEWEMFASQLQERARRNDFEKALNLLGRQPIRPPLQLPVPVARLTEEDKESLRKDFHIDPGDGDLL